MSPHTFLAKSAVETYIKESRIILPSYYDLPRELINSPLVQEMLFKRRAGVFVTIKKNGDLRGCIGTYLPMRADIADEIIHNAIAAATKDYRFKPIRKEELPELSYTVYILNEPELVKNISGLDPKKYGIIVKTVPIAHPNTDVVFNGHAVPKTGLLLPDLKGIDTIEQQISIACQKGGIDPIKEKIMIYRFTVEKYQ